MSIEKISVHDIDSLSFTMPAQSERKPTEHYVVNKELQAEFVEFHKKKMQWLSEGKGVPPLTNKIGAAVLMIAKRRTYSRNFIGYTQAWKDEMIDDAIEACVRYAHNYNPEKYNNPFAYLTQIINNALINRIKVEKMHLYIRYKSFDNAGGFNAYLDENVTDDDMQLVNETSEMYADHLHFINDFESKYMTKAAKDLLEPDAGVLQFLE